MEQGHEMIRQDFRCRFGIIYAFRADFAAPACIHQNQSPWMLNQENEYRQCYPIPFDRNELLCRIAKINAVAKRDSLGNTDAAASQNMDFHTLPPGTQ